MRVRFLVFTVFLCMLVSPGFAGGFSEGEYSDLPTSGGKPAFATKGDLLISSAESFIKSGQYEEALKLGREVTSKYPDYVKGWMILAYCQSLLGNYMASNLAYERALEMGAEPREVYMRTAYNYLKLQNWDGARASYLQILDMDDDDTETLTQLGTLETRLGNSEKALYYYRRVLELEPQNMDVMLSMARLLDHLGSAADAEAMLERALALEPDNAKFLWKLSSIQLKERSYKEALPYLEKLVTVDGDNPKVRRNYGIALYQVGQKGAAAKQFEQVSLLGGDLDGLYGPLADCLRASGQPSKALGFIKDGIRAGEQQAWLYSLWGKILEDGKDYDGAIAKFSQAVKLSEAPWSDYARKQIVRQQQLKKRKEMLVKQESEM